MLTMDDEFLQQVIGDPVVFKADYLSKRPRLQVALADSGIVREILNLRRIDELLSNPAFRPPYVELARAGQAVRERLWTTLIEGEDIVVPDAVDTAAVAEAFAGGTSIILHNLDEFDPQIRQVCAKLSTMFSRPTGAVAFVTPPGSQSLDPHVDPFDGLIVQTYGAKRWFVFEPTAQLTVTAARLQPDQLGDPVVDVTLRAGDCLYVPAGAPHYAKTSDQPSVHLTLMIQQVSWRREIADILRTDLPDWARSEPIDVTRVQREVATHRVMEALHQMTRPPASAAESPVGEVQP